MKLFTNRKNFRNISDSEQHKMELLRQIEENKRRREQEQERERMEEQREMERLARIHLSSL